MIVRNFILIMLATLCFSIIFNIRGKNIFFTALGGGITWIFYSTMMNMLNVDIYSIFAAAMAAGIYSEIMARVLKTPVTVFVICSIIPLVPGGAMYQTMLHTVQGNVADSLTLGIHTLAIAGTIAIGVFVITSSFRLAALINKNINLKKLNS
jgi:uncharacterized membrane protein YjjB (DUF3815 family)